MKNLNQIKDFLSGFKNQHSLPFKCPYCENYSLRLKQDSWYQYDSSKFKEMQEWVEPEDCVFYQYLAIYRCEESDCRQEIMSSGTGSVEMDIEIDGNGEQQRLHYNIFKPKFFNPALHFFEIPKNTPEKIKDLVVLSFSLVLQSPVAAVNSLRSAVEEILADHGIPKNTEKTLHKRIEKDVPQNTKLKDFEKLLMAIKWLGNSGSHGNEIELELILYVYEVLELILNSLYVTDRTQYLINVAQATNLVKRALTPAELSKIT